MDHWSENESEVPEQETIFRRGGPQGEGDDEEAKRKAAEREQKKAEVRKRLEEAGKKGKKKKGFLTPERKKKLRKLLMMKAAENLKNQQKQLESERNNVLSKRLPQSPNIDGIEDKAQLEKIYQDLFAKMVALEEEKYEINFVVSQKDSDINELTIAVNDLRGKFVKPTLKKVSKYDNKFKKLVEGEGVVVGKKEDFRAKLKVVKKENALEAIESKTKKTEKPEWIKKGGAEAKPGNIRRQSAASSKAEEPPAQPVEAEPEPEEEEEEEEEE